MAVKKAIFAAVIGAVFAGCSPFAFNSQGYSYNEENLYTAWKKVSSYKYIYDVAEYWSSPAEFDARGGGDCEDFAFALVYRLGKDARAVCIRNQQGALHEIVEFNGRFLEPQRFGMYYEKNAITVLWVMNYDETMSVSTLWGVKSLETTPPREKDTCIEAFGGYYPSDDVI